jgi:hypothetical protein
MDYLLKRVKITGLSDAEYKEITQINLIATRFRELLTTEIPTSAEQVYLSVMALTTYEDTDKAKTMSK